MSASLIRPQDVETADCLLENIQIGGKHITLHFAEIYHTDLQAFAPNVVIEISDWQQFRGRAYHAKPGIRAQLPKPRSSRSKQLRHTVFQTAC
jgi:hypothetical protein